MFHENKSGDIFAPQTWIDYDGCEVMTNKQDAALAEFYTRRGPEIGWRCPKPSGRIGSSFDSPITGLNCTKSLMCEYSLDCDYWDYNELCDVPLDNVPLYHRNCVAKGFMRDKAMGRESDTTICEPGLGNYSKYPGCPSTPEEVVDSTQEEAMDSTQEEATDSTQEEAVEGRPESSHAHEYYARLSFIMLVWAAFDSYGYR
ncbi:unnamed protein product [Cylindrotheca closterium]|uniref:Uncharacterized protein n=1 Tax=Cylindrotheca closterium TaxID=2856 RepID=A0AAD2G0J4_9STRA|nr:unnamed protein product [Cylindrotheca closterium]